MPQLEYSDSDLVRFDQNKFAIRMRGWFMLIINNWKSVHVNAYSDHVMLVVEN